MNDKLINNNGSDTVADQLQQVAEQTYVNSQFVAELETKLRNARRPQTNWFTTFLQQVSPPLRWVVLMALLGLALSLSIEMLIRPPQPAVNSTPVRQENSTPAPDNSSQRTAVPQGESFDYQGGKLTLGIPLPDSPVQANVYAQFNVRPATAEYARTLADQFGIEGEIYTTGNYVLDSSPAFLVTDGKQQLIVYAENTYDYTSDMVKHSRHLDSFPNENAEAIIREYLKAHGLDFNFKFSFVHPYGYYLEQLAPDGLPVKNMYNFGPYMYITLDENGNILYLQAVLVNYDPVSLGEYRVISAREALSYLLDDNVSVGKIDSDNGPLESDPDYVPPKYWYHDHPDDQTVTIYGNVMSYPSAEPGKPAIVFIDDVATIGNTDGMDGLQNPAYVQATGQFIVENGIRKFKVDAWEESSQVSLIGSAHREGDQVIFETDTGESYILADPPADLTLDTVSPAGLFFLGAAIDGTYYWTSILYFEDIKNLGGGGGGGGGINNLYKLNLSGTPVPFPTSTPTGKTYSRAEIASFLRYTVQPGDTLEQVAKTYNVSVKDLMSVNNLTDSNISSGSVLTIPGVPGPTRLEGERGIVRVQAYVKPDGRQRIQYTFVSEKDGFDYELTGDDLAPLQAAERLPIKIWGSLSFDKNGTTFLAVEKFEVLYPDLQIQSLKGTIETKEIDGTEVNLFTTGSTTYILLGENGGPPVPFFAQENDKGAAMKALQVPGETYAGYPTLRVLMIRTGTDPDTGEPYDLNPPPAMDEPLPDPYGNADAFTPPDVTIDSVELVYIINDVYPSEGETGSSQPKQYVQPAWYFHGHTSDGREVNILVQALDRVYLLPETEP